MSRRVVLAGAVAGVLTLSGCSEAGLTVEDAYKVGCPALDAVAASGSVVGKVALAGLERLRGSGSVPGGSRQWVDVAIQFLSDPATVSEANKKLIRDGCAAHGHQLQNLG